MNGWLLLLALPLLRSIFLDNLANEQLLLQLLYHL